MVVSRNRPHRFLFRPLSMLASSWTDEDRHGPLSGLLGRLLYVSNDAEPFLVCVCVPFRFKMLLPLRFFGRLAIVIVLK